MFLKKSFISDQTWFLLIALFTPAQNSFHKFLRVSCMFHPDLTCKLQKTSLLWGTSVKKHVRKFSGSVTLTPGLHFAVKSFPQPRIVAFAFVSTTYLCMCGIFARTQETITAKLSVKLELINTEQQLIANKREETLEERNWRLLNQLRQKTRFFPCLSHWRKCTSDVFVCQQEDSTICSHESRHF